MRNVTRVDIWDMNSFFEMFIESWLLRVSCKVNEAEGQSVKWKSGTASLNTTVNGANERLVLHERLSQSERQYH